MLRSSITLLLILYQFVNGQDIEISGDKIEYIRKKGKEAIILKGNAKVVQEKTTITADIIKVIGRDKEYAQCFNNIRIKDEETDSILTGDYAEYFSKKKYAKISKKPVLELKKDNTIIRSELMERFIDERKAVATGDVRIKKTNMNTKSERATYIEAEEKLELTGEPQLRVGFDEYFANTMLFFHKENRVLMFGKVKANISLETNKNYDFLSK